MRGLLIFCISKSSLKVQDGLKFKKSKIYHRLGKVTNSIGLTKKVKLNN